ncbi:MAG: ATP-binding cassette domain-containing protein [Lachnospiraceae bacterium]|jgi:NitT/TauT family transport system ATP-binding protein|nr:ATP-binding cassette domain-containing protein [Lachnospiraceae bacterium]
MDIVINSLSKKYGEKEVIKNFSARIKDGSVLSVMAPSGGGKTTLLRILAGLETADKGYIEGLENKKVSMVFQEDRLCNDLNAITNIRIICGKKNNGPKGITDSRIYDELEKAGLKGNEKYPVRELSGGMRRRIAIVRALMADYDILILDEPFAGLDWENKKRMADYIKEKSKGKTVILVTHDKAEAEIMGGEILNLK